MKTHRQELWFNLPTRRGFVNITREVQAAIDQSGIHDGLVLVKTPKIAAGVFINGNTQPVRWAHPAVKYVRAGSCEAAATFLILDFS